MGPGSVVVESGVNDLPEEDPRTKLRTRECQVFPRPLYENFIQSTTGKRRHSLVAGE